MSDAPAAKTLPDMRAAPRTPCFPSQPPLSHPSSSDSSPPAALLSQSQSQSQSNPHPPLPPQPQSSPPHSLPQQNLHSSLRSHPNFKLFVSAPLSSAAPHHHEQMLANALSLSTLSPARHTFLRPDPVSNLSPFPFAPCAQSPTHASNFNSAPLPTSLPHPRNQDVYDPDALAFHFPDSPVRSMVALDIQHSALATPAAIDHHLQQVRSVMDPTVPDIHLVASASAPQQSIRAIDSHLVHSAIPDARLPLGTSILPSPQLPQSSPQATTLSLSPDSHIKNIASQPFHLHHSHHNLGLKPRQQQQSQAISQIQSQSNQHHQPASRSLHHQYAEHSSPMSQTRAFVSAGNILQQRVHPPSSHLGQENPAKRRKPNPKSFHDPSAQVADPYQLKHHKRLPNLQDNRCQLQDNQQSRHHHHEQLPQDNAQKRRIQDVYKKTTDLVQQHGQQEHDNQENQPRFNYHSHPGHRVDHQPNVPVPQMHDPKKLNQHYNYRFQPHQNVYYQGDKQGNSMEYTMERGVDMRPQMLARHATDNNRSVAISSSLSVASGDGEEPGSPSMRQKIACPHACGKEYTRTHALNVHISTKHTGTNQEYQCTVCLKKFNRKDTLKRHFATTHQLQRNWPCKECPKRFGQQAHLNTHVRTVHKKDRPHVCDKCPKSFGTLYNLNAHKNTHMRTEKEYACETCRKTYKIKSSLARHRRKEKHMESSSALPNSTVECPTEEAPIRNPADSLHGMGNEPYDGGR